MGENIFRRVMTRLLFELQVALWHQERSMGGGNRKSPAGTFLDAIIFPIWVLPRRPQAQQ
jgi:hypothetical protein